MQMYLAGEWVDRNERIPVFNPFDGSEVDAVPRARLTDVDSALQGAVAGAAIMRQLPGYERYQILRRAADGLRAREEELARLISLEEGKTLAESRFEVGRAAETLLVSAEEAKRLAGEVLPLDGAPGGANKLGFTLRVPCGIVVAVTPFNFPLNLVCHKVGPALAAGNAVVVKPASDTPLSAIQLVKILLEAGLPPLAIACLTGGGGEIGEALCADPRVRKITFTGSADVGQRICQVAGLKRVTMELGSNSPVIVLPDADLDRAAEATAVSGFANAGQVCISAQRVIAVRSVYADLLSVLRPKVEAISCGNQLEAATRMGPMVRERDAVRVQDWVREAVATGARCLCGGERTGAVLTPTLLADVHPDMRICREEVFGPAVGVMVAEDIAHAVRLANDSRYGLSAAVFTRSLEHAMRFAREVDSGNIHINWGPMWRADLMPYGGLKDSGFGKEGPRYAIEEMTERKTVILHGV